MPVIPVVTPDQAKAWDQLAESSGRPLRTLMESAGRAVAQLVLERAGPRAAQGVLVACGAGHNGGDGWVAARLLHRLGVPVWVVESEPARAPLTQVVRADALTDGVRTLSADGPWPDVALIVDALLGTGAGGAPRGPIAHLLHRLADLHHPIIAVDGGFYSGVLLFHTYAGSEQPAPKSLLAIDAKTGVFLWKLEGYSFVATDGRLLQTGQTQSDLQLNITHRHLRDGSLSAASVLEQSATNASWRFPTEHPESSPYYSVIGQFIQKIIGKTPQKALNYGEIGGHILFFQYLYHANATALSRSILVVNTSKTVLHHETLETDVTSTAFGESFYNEHHLVYLKNLQELVVIKLPKP